MYGLLHSSGIKAWNGVSVSRRQSDDDDVDDEKEKKRFFPTHKNQFEQKRFFCSFFDR